MNDRAAVPARALPRAARAAATTPEQILTTAARLFRTQGYDSTTLRQIAQATGIKAGSIYYHFEGKDEIAARVLDAGIEVVAAAVRDRLAALPADADARARLGAAVEGHLWGLLHHGDFTTAHIRIYRYVSEDVRGRHQPVRSAYTRLWDDLLSDAAAEGALRRDVSVAMIRQYLVGALNWPVDWYDPRRGSFDTFAAQFNAMVCQGITVGGSAR